MASHWPLWFLSKVFFLSIFMNNSSHDTRHGKSLKSHLKEILILARRRCFSVLCLEYYNNYTLDFEPCGFHSLAVVVLVTESCPTLCDPMDCSPPGSSVHGVSQARILVWVAISFSVGSSRPKDQALISCSGRQILYHWATWKPS